MSGFIKTKDCGCVIIAIVCGVKNNSDSKMYILGGHNHLSICDICKKWKMKMLTHYTICG